MRHFDKIVQRLRRHFDRVTIHPPGDGAALHELRKRIPAVPDALLSFWRYCDGIRVTDFEEGDLFGLERSLSLHTLFDETHGLDRFVPMRGDGCGDYDCLVVGAGPCEGAMVFWDHEVYEGAAYLLGGSLFAYLDMWADHMVH